MRILRARLSTTIDALFGLRIAAVLSGQAGILLIDHWLEFTWSYGLGIVLFEVGCILLLTELIIGLLILIRAARRGRITWYFLGLPIKGLLGSLCIAGLFYGQTAHNDAVFYAATVACAMIIAANLFSIWGTYPPPVKRAVSDPGAAYGRDDEQKVLTGEPEAIIWPLDLPAKKAPEPLGMPWLAPFGERVSSGEALELFERQPELPETTERWFRCRFCEGIFVAPATTPVWAEMLAAWTHEATCGQGPAGPDAQEG